MPNEIRELVNHFETTGEVLPPGPLPGAGRGGAIGINRGSHLVATLADPRQQDHGRVRSTIVEPMMFLFPP